MSNNRTFMIFEGGSRGSASNGQGFNGQSNCLETDLPAYLQKVREMAKNYDSLHVVIRERMPMPKIATDSMGCGVSRSNSSSSGWCSAIEGASVSQGRGVAEHWSGGVRHDTGETTADQPIPPAMVYGLPYKPEHLFVWKTRYDSAEAEHDVVCYIPNDGQRAYTNEDVYALCHNDHKLATLVIDWCNWERPEVVLSLGLDKLMPELKLWETECIACGDTTKVTNPMSYVEVIKQRKWKLKDGRIQHVCKDCQKVYVIDAN